MSTVGAAAISTRKAPMSSEELAHEAETFDYSDAIPFIRWLRTANTIQKQAESYERDGNDQQAYLFYFRYVVLVTSRLDTHPGRSDESVRKNWTHAQKVAYKDLSKLEELKPKIKKQYESWQAFLKKNKAQREQFARSQTRESRNPDLDLAYRLATEESRQLKLGAGPPDPVYGKQQLDPAADRELALQLAMRDIGTAGVKKSNRTTSSGRRRSSGADRGRTAYEKTNRDQADEDDISRRIQALGQRQKELSRPTEASDPRRQTTNRESAHKAYAYPSVPPRSSSNTQSGYSSFTPTPPPAYDDAAPPIRPPKVYSSFEASPPPRPAKIDLMPRNEVYEAPDTSASPVELDSSQYMFKQSARTESGAPLRTIFISPELKEKFLKIAHPNTLRNLETCGILCGRLISDAFFITKLVIPEQEATSDTCEMINEGALFDYCDSENLMTLGWIHTHPTQTCFMSSRDCHTHGGYQVQLAESIAIVCAPKHNPSWGCFRLTDPPGLKSILNCKQTGIFHPHAEPNIYTDALKPGHVWELPDLPYDVVDLRPDGNWI